MPVETLPGYPLHAHFYTECITCLKIKVKVTEYSIRNGVIRWRISTSVEVIRRGFAIVRPVSEILIFKICDLEILG